MAWPCKNWMTVNSVFLLSVTRYMNIIVSRFWWDMSLIVVCWYMYLCSRCWSNRYCRFGFAVLDSGTVLEKKIQGELPPKWRGASSGVGCRACLLRLGVWRCVVSSPSGDWGGAPHQGLGRSSPAGIGAEPSSRDWDGALPQVMGRSPGRRCI